MKPLLGGPALFRSYYHLNRRASLVAAVLFLVVCLGGCAMWDARKWNIDGLRDERAVDIDHRLEKRGPIVENPF